MQYTHTLLAANHPAFIAGCVCNQTSRKCLPVTAETSASASAVSTPTAAIGSAAPTPADLQARNVGAFGQDLQVASTQLAAIQQHRVGHGVRLQELYVCKALQRAVTQQGLRSYGVYSACTQTMYTLACPNLSVRMVTRLTVPQELKCICSSSGVHP